jgi:hypothetical protein
VFPVTPIECGGVTVNDLADRQHIIPTLHGQELAGLTNRRAEGLDDGRDQV